MTRVKEYRTYWCGCLRCFLCALYHNGNSFSRWATFTQFLVIIFTVISPILPWLRVSYSTGNHIQRIIKVFDFFDANADNLLDYTELDLALKDKNFAFFSEYLITNTDLIQALLADQSSGCLPGVLSFLQSQCAVGVAAPCLQPSNWANEGGNLMQNPSKIQQCILSLMDPSYISNSGDGCASALINSWLSDGDGSSQRQCLLATSIDPSEFALHARQLVPGLPPDDAAAPAYCVNASVDMYLSVYGSLTVEMSLTVAADANQRRCYTATASVPPGNFTCVTVLDFFSRTGVDLVYAPVSVSSLLFGGGPAAPPQQCRDLAGWILDVFAAQESRLTRIVTRTVTPIMTGIFTWILG